MKAKQEKLLIALENMKVSGHLYCKHGRVGITHGLLTRLNNTCWIISNNDSELLITIEMSVEVKDTMIEIKL